MPAICPYLNSDGYGCRLTDGAPMESTKKNKCLTSTNWLQCENYKVASPKAREDRMRK